MIRKEPAQQRSRSHLCIFCECLALSQYVLQGHLFFLFFCQSSSLLPSPFSTPVPTTHFDPHPLSSPLCLSGSFLGNKHFSLSLLLWEKMGNLNVLTWTIYPCLLMLKSNCECNWDINIIDTLWRGLLIASRISEAMGSVLGQALRAWGLLTEQAGHHEIPISAAAPGSNPIFQCNVLGSGNWESMAAEVRWSAWRAKGCRLLLQGLRRTATHAASCPQSHHAPGS